MREIPKSMYILVLVLIVVAVIFVLLRVFFGVRVAGSVCKFFATSIRNIIWGTWIGGATSAISPFEWVCASLPI